MHAEEARATCPPPFNFHPESELHGRVRGQLGRAGSEAPTAPPRNQKDTVQVQG